MMAGQPIIILREGTERDTGSSARQNNIRAAVSIADAVKSTLGPKGMDKMLVDSMGEVIITNDGATILKELEIEHPAAKMIVEAAKTQDNEVGDGTTTVVLLAGQLLKEADALAEKNVHPTVIASGFSLAEKKAQEILGDIALKVDVGDTKTLYSVALTAMSGKNAGGSNESIAKLAVDAVRSVVEERSDRRVADIDNIKVEKKQGGSVSSSELIKGIIVDKERMHPRMPKSVENAHIALISAALEIKKTEITSSIQIRETGQLEKYLNEEESALGEMVDMISDCGANVVVCEKGVADSIAYNFARRGIYCVQRAKKSDMEKLAKATGARIVADVRDISKKDLGYAKQVEQKKIADEDMTFITGCRNPRAVTVLLRAGTEHAVDELDRAFNDAIRVVSAAIEDGKVLPGGGAPEMFLSLRLKDFSSTVGGREQLAIEAFSAALQYIPRVLAENAGLDPVDTLIEMKNRQSGKDGYVFGISAEDGKIRDMLREKVLEPVRVKKQVIASATEVANMILRIDDVIASKKSEGQGAGASAGGMPGGMPPGMMG